VEDVVNRPEPGNLLPEGQEVAFSDIESALQSAAGDAERRFAGIARTATLVIAGTAERLVEAAQALSELTDIGVRAVLISYGDRAEPSVRVSHHAVALEGLRPEYLNNAVAALRLSSLPTFVWWRGGATSTLEGLAGLADRLVLDALDPTDAWAQVAVLAEKTAVSDLRWARLTRWRALMAHLFDLPDVLAAASRLRSLRIEGSDRYTAKLFAGWLASTLRWPRGQSYDFREKSGGAPVETVALGDGSPDLVLHLTSTRKCVETAARVNGVGLASRIVSLGDQLPAELLGEELRIRARDLAFERAVAASKGMR
jgi:glucose-6-phosphate dehydrogenase assembly protein OpcA